MYKPCPAFLIKGESPSFIMGSLIKGMIYTSFYLLDQETLQDTVFAPDVFPAILGNIQNLPHF